MQVLQNIENQACENEGKAKKYLKAQNI